METVIITSFNKDRKQKEELRKSVFKETTFRLKRGIYCCAEDALLAMYDFDAVIPNGIMCMWSAWYYYNLCDIIPWSSCIAIENHQNVTPPKFPKFDLYYWSKKSLEIGATTQIYNGIEFKIFDIERCVIDSIRFRNKIGIDSTIEIVNNYLEKENKNMELLYNYSKQFHVYNYLKTILTLQNG